MRRISRDDMFEHLAIRGRLLTFVALFAVVNVSLGAVEIPVIYSSDLFHPAGDIDDHYDIATVFALPEIELKLVILDQRKGKTPGKIPVEQLNYITGKDVPYAAGLYDNLRSQVDDGTGQEERYQGAVAALLKTLNESKIPVTIVTTGSLRDIAAAFNRAPDMFKRKVGMVMVFAGAAEKKITESNVGKDTHAFVRIMNSGLPIYWVPCFDGGVWRNNGRSSWWRTTHHELLKYTDDRVMSYFVYAILTKTDSDYIRFIDQPVKESDRQDVYAGNFDHRPSKTGHRDLWCTSVFTYIAKRKMIFQAAPSIVRHGGFTSVPHNAEVDNSRLIKLFDFEAVDVVFDENGHVSYEESDRSNRVMLFKILRHDLYSYAMSCVTANLLVDLGNARSPADSTPGATPQR